MEAILFIYIVEETIGNNINRRALVCECQESNLVKI